MEDNALSLYIATAAFVGPSDGVATPISYNGPTKPEIEIGRLKQDIEDMLARSIPISETAEGSPAWESLVDVLDAAKATGAYAWSSPIEDAKRRLFTALHVGAIMRLRRCAAGKGPYEPAALQARTSSYWRCNLRAWRGLRIRGVVIVSRFMFALALV